MRFSDEAAGWVRARNCQFPPIGKSSFSSVSIAWVFRARGGAGRCRARRPDGATRRGGRRPSGRDRIGRRGRRPNPGGRRGAAPLHAPPASLGGLVARHTGATAVTPRAARQRGAKRRRTSAAPRALHGRPEPRDRLRRRAGRRERTRARGSLRRPPSWPSWQSGSHLQGTSTTCAGASSTAPIGCARQATAVVRSPCSSRPGKTLLRGRRARRS